MGYEANFGVEGERTSAEQQQRSSAEQRSGSRSFEKRVSDVSTKMQP